MTTLGENRYGKSRVRLVRVKRRGDRHEFREWAVEILLRGDFESCFVAGDNSRILPTDTMKNTVYSLARKSSAAAMEEFACELVHYLLERNPQVTGARVGIAQKAWEHAEIDGKPHPTTFVQSTGERQTAVAEQSRNEKLSIIAGLDNLILMKTANSGFEGYLQDSLTTLPPTSDRLLGTTLLANWTYASPDVPFEGLRRTIRDTLLASFAHHTSKSVQHTLYAMGDAVLAKVPQITDIELTMPNIHCLLVDLSRFGQDNPNEIFVPTDEPHGYIEARLHRQE
jgi:urate oxidase